MNWLVMKLVFTAIPKQPMPFFVRPVARALCGTVQQKLIDLQSRVVLPLQDLREINVLNHYIGMKDLVNESFTEFQWMPFVIGALGLPPGLGLGRRPRHPEDFVVVPLRHPRFESFPNGIPSPSRSRLGRLPRSVRMEP